MRWFGLPGLFSILLMGALVSHAQSWECATSAAPWTVRSSGASIGFGDKLFLFNGYKEVSVMWHDIWSSTDGVNWVCEVDSVPYPMSTSMGCVIFNNKIWLLGGRDGC